MIESMTNFWKQFTDLLPRSPTLIASPKVMLSAGVWELELLGGGRIQATSSAILTIDSKVFVKNGQVLGSAPALTELDITISD